MSEPTDSAREDDHDEKPSTPGNAHEVPVPHEEAMEGTSQQTPAADGVLTYPRTSEQKP